MGRSTSHVTKMEYNHTTALTEPEVANLIAKYVEDSFQPLNEPDFDYQYFNKSHKNGWTYRQHLTISNRTPSAIATYN